jgi:RNA polymerase-binding transcription factor DksA
MRPLYFQKFWWYTFYMNKQHFDKAFLKAQESVLQTKKQQLEQELSKRGTKSRSNSNDYKATFQEYGDDLESNAAEYAQTETNASVVEQLENELVLVNHALERFSNGSYGIDVESGKPINKNRLLAYPAAEIDI